MNNEKALSVLITGCRIAQSKGVFTLEDASVILEAIKVFTPAQPEPVKESEVKEEEGVDKKD